MELEAEVTATGVLIPEANDSNDSSSSSSDDLQWQCCTCGENSCGSCRAQKIAIVLTDSNKQLQNVKYNATSHQQKVGPVDDLNKGSAEELATHTLMDRLRCFFNTDIKIITVESSPGYSAPFLFIYWFHPQICDSAIQGRTEFSYASPMIVYKFAYNFMQRPSHLCSKELPQQVQMQVVTAIAKGNERYDELYPEEKKELTVDETLKAWPNIQMKMLFHNWSCEAIGQKFYEWIINLKEDQVLLFFRRKPYKVVSVVCTADPGGVCMFDSQLHRTHMSFDKGAFLFYCEKEIDLLNMMLGRFEYYCFGIQGECHFVLLQKQPLETPVPENSSP